MQLFKSDTHIDFMGKRKLAMIFSILLIVVALGSIIAKGLNLGIDFTGGTLVEVGFPAAVELPSVREKLSAEGFGDAVVQHFGTPRDVLVRLAPQADFESAELSDRAFSAMQGLESSADLRRVEFVGPQVGDELTEDGGLAMLYALIGILIYVGLRFEYRFAVGAVIALIHDVFITIGIFSLFQVEFDLPVLAAVLAVIGYSLNDTIVVYDRIRENFRKIRKGDSQTIINSSLNQTLSRTLVTSMTTLLVLLSLFFFGGEIIHGFALALIVGVVVGTYSSIYVAGSAILMMGVSKADLMPVKKEDETADEIP
ncbi:MAG: protein translocase subunit SecF [Candidatus Thiodiazotropha sp. (ex Gloverina cf. vestifex)]|nr:protein translocase subunit SecF [Candidatus Thiodiazotropha sp. (ex Gloverina cf. vestifex)]